MNRQFFGGIGGYPLGGMMYGGFPGYGGYPGYGGFYGGWGHGYPFHHYGYGGYPYHHYGYGPYHREWGY
ncbi:hypothetical protein J6TS2_22550 [Heyndrickxia sporothermodurans]|nr:hypothetical protein J6TS2_22550 [Heyndrickxia sporothermodurans]